MIIHVKEHSFHDFLTPLSTTINRNCIVEANRKPKPVGISSNGTTKIEADRYFHKETILLIFSGFLNIFIHKAIALKKIQFFFYKLCVDLIYNKTVLYAKRKTHTFIDRFSSITGALP